MRPISWDTKRKLFSLAEVCALPSAALVSPATALLNSIVIMLLSNHPIVTSAAEGEGGYVFTPFCLFVCLFICLCAGYLKKLWTDSDEILWTCWVCDNEELIQFW